MVRRMDASGQQKIDGPHPIHALSEIISPLRLGTYLNAAGHDPDRALSLYLWNAKVGEAFHLPIQSVEVGLRNRVSNGIAFAFGADWWREPAFAAIIEAEQRDAIATTLRRLASRGKKAETGQVIANLSFGFWVAMLHSRYGPSIWSSHLRAAFPNLPPAVERHLIHKEARDVADFRNRLWHHEPIFRRDLGRDYSRCMCLVHWLCPTKAAWIKPHCSVPQLLRAKP